MAVLAGADFFTIEVLTWHGLVTYYVLFFLHLKIAARYHRRHNATPDGDLDDTDGPQCGR